MKQLATLDNLKLPDRSEAGARFGIPGAMAWRMGSTGFGTAPLGNLYAEVAELDAQSALQAALANRIRYFDTAPFYGHGLSEMRLGRALSELPRDSFLISTKVGRLIENDADASLPLRDGFAITGTRARFDYSRDGVRRSFDASLQRLGLDRVDVLLLHDVGRLTHGEQHPKMLRQALDEALPAMQELRDAGVVGAIGIGVNEEAVCLELMPRFVLDCIMLAGRYTLLEQAGAIEVLAQAQQRSVKIIVAGPYNSGLLSDARAPGTTYNYAPADPAMLARAHKIYAICAEHGVDVGAAALQFPLAHPAVVSVVAGQRSAEEVASAVQRRDAAIPAALWRDLKADGILLDSATVPK